MAGVIIHIMLITSQESDNLEDVVTLVTLSSAEASLNRREGWREGKRKRARDDGKGKEKNYLFSLPIFSRALSIFFLLLLFLLGYPAGASEEERDLVMNAAWNSRQNLLGYFVGLFVCKSRGPYGDFSYVKI